MTPGLVFEYAFAVTMGPILAIGLGVFLGLVTDIHWWELLPWVNNTKEEDEDE